MISLLTTQGRTSLVNCILGSGFGLAPIQYMAWGSGTQTVSPTDVALFSPTLNPVRCTISKETIVTSGDTYLCIGTINSDIYQTVSNIGLFDSGLTAPNGQLISQVNPGDTSIRVNLYGTYGNSFPFEVQVSTEVMLVTSGNGTDTFYVTRGYNGSTRSTSIIPTYTPVTGVAGTMFLKSSFPVVSLTPGDSMQFNVSIQFI